MPADLIQRPQPVDAQLRADGRTIYGLVAPFDAETRVVDAGKPVVEVFRHGAFTRTIRERGPERVKLLVQHDSHGKLPIGRAVSLVEQPKGLFGEFRVSRTRDGDEVLELINDGALDGFSIGFVAVRDNWTAGRTRVERLEVKLLEVSVVTFPAYPGAQIAGVRADSDRIPAELARRRLELLRKRIA